MDLPMLYAMLYALLFACSSPCSPDYTDLVGNDIDENCDGTDGTDLDQDGVASWQSGGMDCDDTDANKNIGFMGYFDFDRDGFGAISISKYVCENDVDYVDNADDCNDFSSAEHPNHPEICDLLDNDCDGLVDSADTLDVSSHTIQLFIDEDGDGFGTEPSFRGCFATPNTSMTPLDCDDNNPEIAPNKADIAGNGIDENCDGQDTIAAGCTEEQCGKSISIGPQRLQLTFSYITADSFVMGSPNSENGRDRDETEHLVHLGHDFWIMQTEVTQDVYQYIMSANPSWLQNPTHPVESVSWDDATKFANTLTTWHNTNNGTDWQECYHCTESTCEAIDEFLDCTGFRLPTEAEWEFSARAGTRTGLWTPNGGGNIPVRMEGVAGCEEPWALSDGSNIADIAWFCLNSAGEDAGHHPVKETIPNSFGLFDMHGNVWEWVEDDYSAYTGEITDPLANLHTNSKVVRGGRWAFWAKALRSAERGNYSRDNKRNEVGFRLVQTATPE